MTAAAPGVVLIGAARTEVVVVLANMAISALGGGNDERRDEDQRGASGAVGGGLSAAVVDGPGTRAHRVHDTPVRPGGGGGAAGLGAPRCRGDRHRPGGFGSFR